MEKSNIWINTQFNYYFIVYVNYVSLLHVLIVCSGIIQLDKNFIQKVNFLGLQRTSTIWKQAPCWHDLLERKSSLATNAFHC